MNKYFLDGDYLKLIRICPKAFASNCYALISNGEAMIVDPSVSVDSMLQAVEAENAKIVGILLTHGHFDHMLSLDSLRKRLGVKAMIHVKDAEMLEDGNKNAFSLFFGWEKKYIPAEILLNDGDIISVGDETLKVVHTPGHTQGSVCYRSQDFLITGDTLFSDNVGRSDLWGGDNTALARSLERLSQFDPDLTIYPGHGPEERLGNALDNASYFRL